MSTFLFNFFSSIHSLHNSRVFYMYLSEKAATPILASLSFFKKKEKFKKTKSLWTRHDAGIKSIFPLCLVTFIALQDIEKSLDKNKKEEKKNSR